MKRSIDHIVLALLLLLSGLGQAAMPHRADLKSSHDLCETAHCSHDDDHDGAPDAKEDHGCAHCDCSGATHVTVLPIEPLLIEPAPPTTVVHRMMVQSPLSAPISPPDHVPLV